MGLEGIELVMAVEERFNIAIPDEQVERMRTPRDLMAFVAQQVNALKTTECLSQRTFHRLRRSAISTLRIRRDQFHPSSVLNDLFPRQGRRQAWKDYWTTVGVEQWPALERSSAVVIAISIPMVLLPLLTFSFGLLIAGAAVIALVGFGLLATRPLAVHIPEKLAAVSDLVSFAMARPELQPAEGWSPESIRVAVRQIIVEQLSISPDFSDDARFVEDLGVDQ